MNTVESILASGYVGWEILVPVLRLLSSVLFAIAVSKDCKSRNNASAALWGLMVLLAPVLFGILYFVFSRFLWEKPQEDDRDKKKAKQSKILFITAGFIYVVMLVVLIVSIIVTVSSAAASILTDELNNLLIESVYLSI
ncbi:MAG: hypothetical protein J1E81_02320 [Eubacterium sp.]|nr:hypothetical protein [Eubacterium sp.]